jgi:hypothetical protein
MAGMSPRWAEPVAPPLTRPFRPQVEQKPPACYKQRMDKTIRIYASRKEMRADEYRR